MRFRSALLVSVLLVVGGVSVLLGTQAQEESLVQQLLGNDIRERHRALDAVRALGAENASPRLRGALITLLEEMNTLVAATAARGQPLADVENPEFIARLGRTVAELNDARTIPALSRAIYGGLPVIGALADFGETAVPSVLDVVTPAESHYNLVNHGLIALRFIVEQRGMHPLSPGTVEAIRRAAAQRLVSPGERMASTGVTLRYAIDLAVVLGDPELRRAVEALASDPDEIVARGVTDPDLIAMTRKHAADRLAGVQPLPRR